MAEYIEREKAIEHIETHLPYRCSEDFIEGQKDCVEQLKSLPSADVVEVVHGEWVITHDFDDNYEAMRPLGRVVRCSVCGYPTGHTKTNFCPECGAKMRGDKK